MQHLYDDTVMWLKITNIIGDFV